MKVVINTCYGGFGLSPEAAIRAVERGVAGIKKHDAAPWLANGMYKFSPVRDGYEAWLSAGDLYDTLLKDTTVYSMHGVDRDCPILVRIVEEMGGDASGRLAELKVVEIPDGVSFEIVDYDGREHIAETHRTWA